jgi:hypothetical protein
VIEAKEQVDLPEVVLAGCRGVRMVMDQISSPLTDDMLLDVPVQPMVKRDGEEGGSESGGSKKEKKKKKKK